MTIIKTEDVIFQDVDFNFKIPFENIKIVGVPKVRKHSTQLVVKCSICAKDVELFGDGLFLTSKANVLKHLPCGCSKSAHYKEEQAKILASRMATNVGLEFQKFTHGYEGKAKSHCTLLCKKHNITWDNTPLQLLLSRGTNSTFCPLCFKAEIGKANRKSDEFFLEKFKSTGAFVEGTIFKRSEDITNKQGHKVYWEVFCPSCLETSHAHSMTLSKGQLPCKCSVNRQEFTYLLRLSDNGAPVGLKFGIAVNVEERVNRIRRKATVDIDILGIWKYDTSANCKTAEKQCKALFGPPVLSRSELPDGWCETTSLSNYQSIVEMFENYGGVIYYEK